MKTQNNWLLALKKTVPVMAGYLVLGTGYGILMRAHGYGLLLTVGMSIFVYAGSLQYVLVDLLTGGAGLITTAVTSLLVNARHLFYGVTMLEKYRGTGVFKPYLIFSLTDETYSLVVTGEQRSGAEYFRISLMDHCYWVAGTVIGSLAGTLITFSTQGIDFSLTALFLTVFVEQWLTAKDHKPALIGLGASIVCLLIFGAGSFLLPSMAAILVLMALSRRVGKGENAHA